MQLTAPLSKQTCQTLNLCKEFGSAEITLIPHCSEKEGGAIVIACDEQRSALELKFGKTYVEVSNQCSATKKPVESEKMMELMVSLGCAATNPRILAALLDTELTPHELDDNWQSVHIIDSPGKRPRYWECHITPIEDGQPSLDWKIDILYGIIKIDQGATMMFSPDQPRELKFSVQGFQHPDLKRRGSFHFSNQYVGIE